MWLRCDVLAHRSTNSPRRSPQGGLLTLQFLPLNEAPVSKKMSRLANRTAEPWGVDRRFATLQRADCTVCFVYLLESYFRTENLSREQISFENCFKYYNYLLHLKIFSLIHGELVCHQLKQNCKLDWSRKKYGAIIRPLKVDVDS